MNKDAEGRWKVGRSYIKLKMRVEMAPTYYPGVGDQATFYPKLVPAVDFLLQRVVRRNPPK